MLLSEAHSKLNSIDKTNAPIPSKNKGGRGIWIEKQLGMKQSSQLNDFEDGELKAYKHGQTIAVTMVQHCLGEILESKLSYSKSKVGRKLYNVLFVKFTKSGEFVGSLTFNDESHQELCNKLEEDYNYICEEIRRRYELGKELTTINGSRDKNGVNKLLQIRTKASKTSKGTYVPLVYNSQQLKDKAMAFYLTNKFEKLLFN